MRRSLAAGGGLRTAGWQEATPREQLLAGGPGWNGRIKKVFKVRCETRWKHLEDVVIKRIIIIHLTSALIFVPTG